MFDRLMNGRGGKGRKTKTRPGKPGSFNESEHPRGNGGRFAAKPDSEKAKKAVTRPPPLTSAQMKTVSEYREKIKNDHTQLVGELKSEFGKDHAIEARVKKPDSIAEKLARKPEKYKGDPANLQDISGLRIVTKSQADQEAVVAKFKSKYDDKIIKGTEDNFYKTPQSPDPGYRAFHATIERNGMPHEVQIKTENMSTWSECNHPLYKNDPWTKGVGKDPEVQAYMRKAADVYQQRDRGINAKLPPTPQKLKDLEGWTEITRKFGWG